ncbi:MAG: hypothetical protein KBT88_13930 [Gammaproteobacteria bacterium]|nr:hypothetical protein [Gammaproteobacteria bacterium]MBQ0840880.1 hypothetical protein [Gammaproteobacteria bacterium]
MLNLPQKEVERFLLEVFKCYHDDGLLMTSFESILHPIQAFLPFDAMYIGIIKDVSHFPHRLTMHEYSHSKSNTIDLGESIQTKISDNTLCHTKNLEQAMMTQLKTNYSGNWDETHFASETGSVRFNFSNSPYRMFAGIYTEEALDNQSRTLFSQLMPLFFLKASRAYTDGSIPALTKRQQEVLFWIKEGKTAWDISQLLVVSERTVNFHLDNIFKKLEAVNRPHAVARAISYGLLSP